VRIGRAAHGQGTVIGELNRRKGVIQSSEESEGMCTIEAEVRWARKPL